MYNLSDDVVFINMVVYCRPLYYFLRLQTLEFMVILELEDFDGARVSAYMCSDDFCIM